MTECSVLIMTVMVTVSLLSPLLMSSFLLSLSRNPGPPCPLLWLIQVCLCFAPCWKLLMHLSSLALFPTVWINGWYCPCPGTDLKVYNNFRPISHFLQNLLSRLLPVASRLVCLVKKKYGKRFNLGSGEKIKEETVLTKVTMSCF